MPSPRVLVVLDTAAAWSRGILRGFARVAHEQGWQVLHYHPDVDLDWVTAEWPPRAAILGPSSAAAWPARLRGCVAVSVNCDRSAQGIASVCLDEAKVADVALAHFQARGFGTLTTFRFDRSTFAVLRERHFCEAAARAGARIEPGWWVDGANPPRSEERPAAIAAWLAGLRTPCVVFACCDPWARVVAR